MGLSRPAEKDITVTLGETPEKASAKAGEEVLGTGSIEIKNPTVTFTKGSQVSNEEVTIALKDGDALQKVAKNGSDGVTTISIVKADGVGISSNYNLIKVTSKFSVKNIDEDGVLDDKTQLDLTSYTVTTNTDEVGTDINDGKDDTYYMNYMSNSPEITINLKNETDVKAIGLVPMNYWGEYSMSIKKCEIFTSQDGTKWTSQGIATAVSVPTDFTPFPVVFYSAAPCKFVKIKPMESFIEARYYTPVGVSDIYVYK